MSHADNQLLSPAQLLSKFSVQVVAFKQARLASYESPPPRNLMTLAALAKTLSQMCRKKIAALDENDAILIANREPAGPVQLNYGLQFEFIAHTRDHDKLIQMVCADIRDLGWRVNVGRDACQNPQGFSHYRDVLHLYPL